MCRNFQEIRSCTVGKTPILGGDPKTQRPIFSFGVQCRIQPTPKILSMPAPSAPLVQVITCNNGKSLSDMKQRHHAAMEHKLDLVAADGSQGSIILWSGENAFKAMLAAGEFQDKQRCACNSATAPLLAVRSRRIHPSWAYTSVAPHSPFMGIPFRAHRLWRRIKSDRQFDVASPPTRVAFEASGKELSAASAVVMASGTLQTDQTPTECFTSMEANLEAMARAFGSVSGAIGQLYLHGTQGQESKKIGVLMLFADDGAAEEYVASEAWATSKAELPWADVTLEHFAVASDASAAAA